MPRPRKKRGTRKIEQKDDPTIPYLAPTWAQASAPRTSAVAGPF